MEKEITIMVNGVQMKGTPTQLKSVLGNVVIRKSGDVELFYNSSTKGLIYIPDMDTTHIYNAVKKLISYGTPFGDAETFGLLHELFNRAKEYDEMLRDE
jgi:hypothetical protein